MQRVEREYNTLTMQGFEAPSFYLHYFFKKEFKMEEELVYYANPNGELDKHLKFKLIGFIIPKMSKHTPIKQVLKKPEPKFKERELAYIFSEVETFFSQKPENITRQAWEEVKTTIYANLKLSDRNI